MNPLRAIAAGAAILRRDWRVWLLFYGVTLGFAAIVILPVVALLHIELGHSLYSIRLFDNFDPEFLAEALFRTGGAPLWTMTPVVAALGLAYLLLMTFLNGGMLAVFTGTDAFWSGCGRNFGRLLRLAVYGLVCYGLAIAAGSALGGVGRRIWGEGMEEKPLVVFGGARAAVVLVLLLLLNFVFDYAKIRAVAENRRFMGATVLRSIGFLARHLIRTGITYALLLLAVLAAAAGWWALSNSLPRSPVAWLGVTLVLQQICVLLRIALRLLFFSSQTALYRSLRPEPAGPAGEDLTS